VEKFYLFFDPWFSVIKKKVGETEYGIGWLPLGGYVKISGMVDESMDKEQLAGPPQPWEFRSKPTWQRLIIMLGGVTVNFILGFLIFGLILYGYGEQTLPAKNLTYGIAVDSVGYDMGLRDGDQIKRVGDETFEFFDGRTIIREIVLNDAKEIEVERDGRTVVIPIDQKYVGELSSSKNKGVQLISPRMPYIALKTVDGSGAEKAGIQEGDRIIGFDDTPTPYLHDFIEEFPREPETTYDLKVIRDSDTMTLAVQTSEAGQIGLFWQQPDYFFEMERRNYSLAQALPLGVVKGTNFLVDQIKAFGQMFRGKIKASESLGGFGTIANLFPDTWEWESFWRVTAVLSLILGFMNLLPIPALDGGHVMFLMYEMVTGRKPSDKFLEYATIAGFVILVALLLYANGLDVMRWWNK
jgi:regulator of sigma E protease